MKLKNLYKYLILFYFIALLLEHNVYSSMLASFDFENNSIELGFDNWNYYDKGDSECNIFWNATAQSRLCSYDSLGRQRAIFYYYNGYNNNHMGWLRWGYIDSSNTSIKNNSLKIVITGGAYDNNGVVAYDGLEVKSKSQYFSHIYNGNNPIGKRILPGDVTLYFKLYGRYTPFEEFNNTDRLSVWALPAEEAIYNINNFYLGNNLGTPIASYAWYPFVVDANGDHYYHLLYNINMGGWIHLIFDAHPYHNNAGDHNPYSYYRAGGYDFPGNATKYFENVNGFGIRIQNLRNLNSPVYTYLDEINAYKVQQPENDETISGIGVGYDPNSKIFDISFNDKYRCLDICNAKYEVRYSFEPITNLNYNNSKIPKLVINFDRSKNNNQGIIYKSNSGYNGVWAAIELQDEDKTKLTDYTTIYFAVKDISNRSMMTERDTYDLEYVYVEGLGNIMRKDLVKTIDYTIYPVYRPLRPETKILKTPILMNSIIFQ